MVSSWECPAGRRHSIHGSLARSNCSPSILAACQSVPSVSDSESTGSLSRELRRAPLHSQKGSAAAGPNHEGHTVPSFVVLSVLGPESSRSRTIDIHMSLCSKLTGDPDPPAHNAVTHHAVDLPSDSCQPDSQPPASPPASQTDRQTDAPCYVFLHTYFPTYLHTFVIKY